MLKFKTLWMKNFLSIGNVTQVVQLAEHGLTLIIGENHDGVEGVIKNGSGKTAILQAISYVLYGWPLTKIRIDLLCNNVNDKGMLVCLEFEKDGKKFRIERGRKPVILRFFVDGKEMRNESDEALGENKHTQTEIERIVGMSYTMFQHIVALNTYTEPFLKMRVSDQREVIEELMAVTQISQRAEVLKKMVSTTKETIRDEEARIRATTEANQRIEVAVGKARTESSFWERTRRNRIKALMEEIVAVESIDFDGELAAFDAIDAFRQTETTTKNALATAAADIQQIERELQVLRSERSALASSAQDSGILARLASDLTRKAKEEIRLTGDLARLDAEIAAATTSLDSADESICVCCNQPLDGTDHLKTVIANLTEQRDVLLTRRSSVETSIRHVEAEIAFLKAETEKTQQENEARKVATEKALADLQKSEQTVLTRRDVALAHHASIQEELRSLGTCPVTIFQSRDEAYAAKHMRDSLAKDIEAEEAKVDPFLNQIRALEATVSPISYDRINEANVLLKHQDFLLKLLTSKDSFVRKKIIEQNLSYLNARLNYYLDKIGLPHKVNFLADLSVEITRLGKELDFAQLSRGEQNRVNLATSWSFRDVWESTNDTINLVFVDEMLDQGTDGQGAEAGLSVLKTMARDRGKNVFLISHRDELVGRIDNVLTARKENDFTEFF